MKPIYLDHNATTPIHPLVTEAMLDCFRSGYGNPASQHGFGRQARRVLEDARETVMRLLGASSDGTDPDRLVLTSGGTESNNLALFGLAGRPPGNVVISAIEHPSVLGAADHLRGQGFEIRELAVSGDGVIELGRLPGLLDDQTRLASLMMANNETGVVQPIAEAARICRGAGVPLHTDAVQAVGKTPVNFHQLGVDALTLTAHKFHGPRGVGGLLVRGGRQLEPILFGGFQQFGLRPGTESVALAVGLCKALQLASEEGDQRWQLMTTLRDRLESQIRSALPASVVVGAAAPRLPHTSNIAFPGLDRQALLMALDLAGVACSTGSACASGSSEPSAVLLAMGCSEAIVEGSLRFSLGALTSAAEIDQASSRIIQIVNNLQQQK